MKIIVFDTETTGFPSLQYSLEDQPYICQFAACILDCNVNAKIIKIEKKISQLLKPKVSIPYETTQIHGISDEMVKDKPTFEDAADRLIKLFSGCDLACAHNIAFDQSVIEYELLRAGKSKDFLPDQVFDTMTETKSLCKLLNRRGEPKQPKLIELHQFLFDEGFDGAHDALNDVLATVRCLEKLFEMDVFRPVEPDQVTLF